MDPLKTLSSTNPSDRAACLAALRQLQADVLPRAASSTPLAARQLLLGMGGRDEDGGRDDDNDDTCGSGTAGSSPSGGLGRALLGIVGDSSAAEICRERAVLLLKALLLKSVAAALVEQGRGGDCADDEASIRSRGDMVRYYVDYCGTVCRRIASPSSKLHVERRGLPSSGSESGREPSESIRLELLLVLSPLLGLLPNADGDDHDDDDDDDDGAMVEEASSQLCMAMTQGYCPALLDPYAAIHREGCHIILQLAVKTPTVVAQHSSELLAKLVGTVGDQRTAAGTCVGLMTHRQAKTRCVAIDAVAAILCCCDRDSTGSGTDASRIEELLESAHVLTRWEEGPAFDRSAQVRLSVQRSLGKVSRAVFLLDDDNDDDDDQTEKSGSMLAPASNTSDRPSTSSVGRRLVSLLLVGLSDDVECVREVASEEMLSLRGGGGDSIQDDLLLKYANVVLLNLLQGATQTSVALEKRVRILHAATRLLEELIKAGDMNSAFVGVDRDDSAPSTASSLCICLDDDCIELSSAASTCAQVLGTDTTSSTPLIRFVLDTLRGGPTIADFDGRHPLPGHSVSSSLSLLESLLRGLCTAMSEAAAGNDGRITLIEIGAILHSEIVLDAIFTTEKSASSRTLLGACDAFSDVVHVAASASGSECSDVSSMIEQIIIAAMYLLSANNETDARALYSSFQLCRSAIDSLLDKTAALCGNGHCSDGAQQSRSDLMRRNFRGVLSALHPKDGVGEDQYISRHLGAFGALIQSSEGNVVAENYDLVGPILGTYANKEESKFTIMALLESVASDKAFVQTIDPSNVVTIVENVVLPNLIWSVGGLSAALRKISLASLFSLLRNCNIEERALMSIALRIIPVLRSHLSDDDASTKELACYCIANIVDQIDVLTSTLGKKEVSCLCVDVSKLLEDESNSVRIAACGALESFLSNMCCRQDEDITTSSTSRFIIRQLQNHSLDPCELIHDAVSKALHSAKTFHGICGASDADDQVKISIL